MDKRARQLDQPLVKRAIRPLAVLQPEMFENFVRFEKKSAVKTIEIAQIMRIKPAASLRLDEVRDALAFVAHYFNLSRRARRVTSLGAPGSPQPCRAQRVM